MSSALTKSNLFDNGIPIRILLFIVLASASGLSIKAGSDLARNSAIFPVWFVPCFILAIILLIALSVSFVIQAHHTEDRPDRVTKRESVWLWILMMISFICTTSVHGFYPFHRGVLSILPAVDSVMKTNYALAVLGFLACTALAGVYLFSRTKQPALIGLLLISLMMLIPNDNCANPFNFWWIKTLGASPHMYVPNMYAGLFVTCGLYGIQPKAAGILTTGICVGSLILGVGHQLGIIW